MKAISTLLSAIFTGIFIGASTSVLFSTPAHALSEEQAIQMLSKEIRADEAKLAPERKPQALAADDAVCSRSTIQNRDVKWCVQPTDRSKNPFVIYFFHGLTLDEHRWQEAQFAADLQSIWSAKGFAPPTIVTISFGPVWLLTQARDKKYDFFINTLMPYFESKIGTVLPEQRIAMGESMGGFNVSQLLLKNPELFSRFVLQCPAVTEVGPFDPNADLVAFVKRTGADWKLAVLTKIIGAYEMQNEPTWLNHSPLGLSADSTSLPTKVYLSCGNGDRFGFYEGTGVMSLLLANKTQGLEYMFIPGGSHGTVDAQSMADFVSADWTQSP